MGVNSIMGKVNRNVLIINAPNSFYDDFFLQGYDFKLNGDELGQGIIFVRNAQDIEENIPIVVTTVDDNAFFWLAYDIHEPIALEAIEKLMRAQNMHSSATVDIDSNWRAMKFQLISPK